MKISHNQIDKRKTNKYYNNLKAITSKIKIENLRKSRKI